MSVDLGGRRIIIKLMFAPVRSVFIRVHLWCFFCFSPWLRLCRVVLEDLPTSHFHVSNFPAMSAFLRGLRVSAVKLFSLVFLLWSLCSFVAIQPRSRLRCAGQM